MRMRDRLARVERMPGLETIWSCGGCRGRRFSASRPISNRPLRAVSPDSRRTGPERIRRRRRTPRHLDREGDADGVDGIDAMSGDDRQPLASTAGEDVMRRGFRRGRNCSQRQPGRIAVGTGGSSTQQSRCSRWSCSRCA